MKADRQPCRKIIQNNDSADDPRSWKGKEKDARSKLTRDLDELKHRQRGAVPGRNQEQNNLGGRRAGKQPGRQNGGITAVKWNTEKRVERKNLR